MTDFRALCLELTDCLEKADWPHQYKVVFQQWTDIARAALAEQDEPVSKEQALALLDDASDRLDAAHYNTNLRALESLPD